DAQAPDAWIRCWPPGVASRQGLRPAAPGAREDQRHRGRGVQTHRRGVDMTKFKFLRKRNDYYRHFTVLDIGTDLIKVLVVRRDGLDGEVLGVGREARAPAAMSGGAIADLESVIQSCNRAREAADARANTVPR